MRISLVTVVRSHFCARKPTWFSNGLGEARCWIGPRHLLDTHAAHRAAYPLLEVSDPRLHAAQVEVAPRPFVPVVGGVDWSPALPAAGHPPHGSNVDHEAVVVEADGQDAHVLEREDVSE
jgi:hypothetical protein